MSISIIHGPNHSAYQCCLSRLLHYERHGRGEWNPYYEALALSSILCHGNFNFKILSGTPHFVTGWQLARSLFPLPQGRTEITRIKNWIKSSGLNCKRCWLAFLKTGLVCLSEKYLPVLGCFQCCQPSPYTPQYPWSKVLPAPLPTC